MIPFRSVLALLTVALTMMAHRSHAILEPTGIPTNLGIDGQGWFVLRDPLTGRLFATRWGPFFLDADGYWTTFRGFRLQARAGDGSTGLIDLRVHSGTCPPTNSPTAALNSFEVEEDGRQLLNYADGSSVYCGQVILQRFARPERLVRIAPKLFLIVAAAEGLAQPAIPGTSGVGTILGGALEHRLELVTLALRPPATETGIATAGPHFATAVPSDLAVFGHGFFAVRDTNTSQLFATRAGTFLRDGAGYLVTYRGHRLRGFSDPALTVQGDVRIDDQGRPPTSDPNAVVAGYDVRMDGAVIVRLTDGTSFVRGKIIRWTAQAPESLIPAAFSLYSGVAAAGLVPAGYALDAEYGTIHQGQLEPINISSDVATARAAFKFFPQGAILSAAGTTNVALLGPGFFVVREASTNQLFVTRVGRFRVDASSYLTTESGMRVQGFNDTALSVIGDLKVDVEPPMTVSSFRFDQSGQIWVKPTEGPEVVRGQILLQAFAESFRLTEVSAGLYGNLASAGPLGQPVVPGTLGLARIQPEALEVVAEPPALNLPSRTGRRLLLVGDPGAICTIQSTVNYEAWPDLGEVTLTGLGEGEFGLPIVPGQNFGVFRADVEFPFIPGPFPTEP